jgi:hypothetical protein
MRTSAPGYRAAATAALICAFSQLAACAAPYSLPPSVTTAVGEGTNLVCGAGEVQICRDGGSTLRCGCVEH